MRGRTNYVPPRLDNGSRPTDNRRRRGNGASQVVAEALALEVVMTDLWTAIGTVAVTLFGVWRMLAHYETRNDAAHAELGRRIDSLAGRIDRVYELIAGQRS